MTVYLIMRTVLQIGVVTAVGLFVVARTASAMLGSRGHAPFSVMVSDSFKPQLNVYIA